MKLTFADITAGYTETPAIRDIDVTIGSGEFVAVVGPNGSGKSTLLKTIYRAVRPRHGHVVLGEDDLWRIPHRRVACTVDVLGQDRPAVTTSPCAKRSGSAATPPQHVRPAHRPRPSAGHRGIAPLRRAHLADRPLSTLSGEERQRVLLARALARQPRLLVLDEPTNHLDPERQIAALELAASLGVTVLTALHPLDLAAQYATTVIVLHRSRIHCIGAPRQAFGPDVLRDVFNVAGSLIDDPITGAPRVLLRPRTTGRADAEDLKTSPSDAAAARPVVPLT